MRSDTYYNDNDRKVCAWLRELMAGGHVPEGWTDERSIKEVQAKDVAGYRACHWFAGIGGWPLAISLAGWPADRPVWTASCPCQPYSAAGKGHGDADARNLWPDLFRLVRESQPPTVLGEQVEAAIGYGWLDGVFADLEAEGYAVGAAVLPAACVGAPHQRHRIFWVATRRVGNTNQSGLRRDARATPGPEGQGQRGRLAVRGDGDRPAPTGDARGLVNAERAERRADDEHQQQEGGLEQATGGPGGTGYAGRLDDSLLAGREGQQHSGPEERRGGSEGPPPRPVEPSGSTGRGGLEHADGGEPGDGELQRGWQHRQQQEDSRSGFWDDFELLPCRDGKVRRAKPGIFPLAPRFPGRVGLLRGAGNAIVPLVAAAFVRAFLEAEADQAEQGR